MNDEQKPMTERRSGRDRRKLFDVYHPADQGDEKQDGSENRVRKERRVEWRRVSKWGSVPPNPPKPEEDQ
jgi:hypothetical protein